ncbi:hypothetical protein AB0M45_17160 [Nocardia sp. NPDC051787]|uniref:hypothetical protein n=1 Tax=Nocardia sp. NPDC051787 TaxID=3155415 RepID=UPI003421ADC6
MRFTEQLLAPSAQVLAQQLRQLVEFIVGGEFARHQPFGQPVAPKGQRAQPSEAIRGQTLAEAVEQLTQCRQPFRPVLRQGAAVGQGCEIRRVDAHVHRAAECSGEHHQAGLDSGEITG